MQFVILGIMMVAALAINYYLKSKKKTELLSQGKIVDRGSEHFKQAHFFTTKTDSLSEIGTAIDKNVLGEEKISFDPRYSENIVVFHNNKGTGTFIAALRSNGKKGDFFQYRFQVEKWTERNRTISMQDIFGANVLLTAIEKAFIQLDRDTDVQRAQATYKTKTKFF